MTVSLNEMHARANAFVQAHQNDGDEHAHSQSFLNDFFHIFDIRRAKVAAFLFERYAELASKEPPPR